MALATGFFGVSMFFAYQSFYGMRIEGSDMKGEGTPAASTHSAGAAKSAA
jgi:hypothetical protein